MFIAKLVKQESFNHVITYKLSTMFLFINKCKYVRVEEGQGCPLEESEGRFSPGDVVQVTLSSKESCWLYLGGKGAV